MVRFKITDGQYAFFVAFQLERMRTIVKPAYQCSPVQFRGVSNNRRLVGIGKCRHYRPVLKVTLILLNMISAGSITTLPDRDVNKALLAPVPSSPVTDPVTL
jgi:hypothetical protein